MITKRPASMTGFFIFMALMTLTCPLYGESLAGGQGQLITETSYYTNIETKGRNCADGKYHDLDTEMVAASWDYKLGSILRVSTLDGSKSICVCVVDRGPAKRLYNRGRKLDLSARAFSALFPLRQGIGKVRVETIGG